VHLEENSDRVSDLGHLRVALRSVWSREAFGTVDDILAEGDFDVMHVQNFFPLFSPSVYYAARRHGVPVVQSLRNFRLVCPQGMLFRNGEACFTCVGKVTPWPSIQYGCYRGSRAGAIAVTSMSAAHKAGGTWRRLVDRYVTPSWYAAGVFIESGWDPAAITAIPNYVHPDPGPGDGDGGFALYVGRLAPSKGVPAMLRAWTEHGLDIPLKIVGDGELRGLVADEASRSEWIDYLGPLSVDRVLELMGRASFIVVPTAGIETFGRVVAEAQARGTPSLVSDLGALTEIVVDGETGWRVPPGDVAALADRARQMWADDAHGARSMRAAARASFEQHFSSGIALRRWEELYADVIKREGR
jgi:glycosyltransferase involved in cell wall biosynthesis